MNDTSGQVKMIHAEVETREFWKGQRLFDDILSLMQQKGFYPAVQKIYGHGQGNAIFLRNEITCGVMVWLRAYSKGLWSRINHSVAKRLNR